MSQQSERERLRREYGELFSVLAEILFRHDPMGINFEENTDEYEPEVGTILPRLRHCKSVEDVAEVVRKEFLHWFDFEPVDAKEKYQAVAEEIWRVWSLRGDSPGRE